MSDRYLRIVLTVIAVELFWLGMKDFAAPVSAQQEPQRVVIAGIEIGPTSPQRGTLPIVIRNADIPLRIQADRPLRIEAERPLAVQIDRPVKIEADRPIKVENVGYTPAQRPGD